MIGRTGEVSVSVVTPKAALNRLEVVLAQDGTTVPVFTLTQTNARRAHRGRRPGLDHATIR